MLLTLINKKSTTPGAVPAAADLLPGEIAVNVADKKWFTKTTAGNIICLNMLTLLDGGVILDLAAGLSLWKAEFRESSYHWS